MAEQNINSINELGIKFLNLGASLISKNCEKASQYIKWGLLMNPEESIGWYNAGISFHVQKKNKFSDSLLQKIS